MYLSHTRTLISVIMFLNGKDIALSLALPAYYTQCTQASSPSVFRLGRDGRQVGDICPGRTP